MYAGRRRILIQGAVSEACHARHAAWMRLHKTLQSAGPSGTVRKYVDDIVLVAKRTHFAVNLCQAYRRAHRSLTQANMKVNLKKTVVRCNAAKAKRLVMKVWKSGGLPPLKVTTHQTFQNPGEPGWLGAAAGGACSGKVLAARSNQRLQSGQGGTSLANWSQEAQKP
eukprot:5276304-Amphidinium_carterae.2